MIGSNFSVVDNAVSLRGLLDTKGLDLHPFRDPALPEPAWDRPVSWVHSSDLLDPSPFLEPGIVLLTTGTQFTPAAAGTTDPGTAPAVDWDAYVDRLVHAGVVGLGFGTEVVRDGVPSPLVAACSQAALPLFEVPFQTPFIAVARANAAAVAMRDDAQRTWALTAQRALTRAALGPAPLPATIRTLATQLNRWVGLMDVSGELTLSHAPGVTSPPSPEDLRAVTTKAESLLRRASRAAGSVESTETSFGLQTVSGNGRLTGVLAVTDLPNAPEAQSVVSSALALLGLATGQEEGLLNARLSLRTGLLALLLRGEIELASQVAVAADESLPAAPVTALLGGSAQQAPQLSEWLAARPVRTRSGVLAGRYGDRCLALISPAAAPHAAAEIVRHLGGIWGLSDVAPLTDLGRAAVQAETAREAGLKDSKGDGLTRYSEVVGHDVLPLLRSEKAAAAARHALEPLAMHDERHGTELVATLTVWLRHDCRNEDTALALGVHRHTIRTRIRLAERVLGHSLSDFQHRAQLWTALRLTR
ncbi:PucR family transcriptional regulator [Galactobacter sp.]|uniref:PucR family transcriptional regulator n=1 Tax=Galactobacter sp. TaxID=2676125 RepID=UPI0025B86D92|nr:PucR family transcriptional regulator [Galactobacter sp.]